MTDELPRLLLSMAISLCIALPTAEVATRLYTSAFLAYDVEMSRYANELKVAAADPRIGHLHRPGAHARVMGVDVEINSNGFRDHEYTLARNGKRRIIALGDSLTFAWGVEEERGFVALLETALNRERATELINFGTGNYNTVQEVELFLEKGIPYAPDRVVVFWFINDAEPTPVQSRWGVLSHSRAVTFFWSRIHAAMANLWSSESYLEYYSSLYRDDQPGWAAARDAFLELRDACGDRGIDLRVVLLPELHDLAHYPLAPQHAKVRHFLAESGIANLDLAPFFADEREPRKLWVANDDAHPNARAHQLIARYSLAFVAGHGGDGELAN